MRFIVRGGQYLRWIRCEFGSRVAALPLQPWVVWLKFARWADATAFYFRKRVAKILPGFVGKPLESRDNFRMLCCDIGRFSRIAVEIEEF